jgi:alkylation response protein AidB-like acyl-CoA dehydrogenase
MNLQSATLTAEQAELVKRLRAFLARELPPGRQLHALGVFQDHDPDFSGLLAVNGFVSTGLPEEYGGRSASAVERFLIDEELYAKSAPVQAHTATDRQTGPCILSYGSKSLRDRFLPRFARAEISFSRGFSEPDAGSDLASVRTTATKVDGGWLVNGTKLWTSYAHLNDYFTVLLRTSKSDDRHEGLSQLIVDLRAPGVKVNPVLLLNGSHHVNEVVLTDAFVPDDMVLGEVGMGWQQATTELSYERSSPDRYMSGFPMLEAFVREYVASPTAGEAVFRAAGNLVSRFLAIRHMSLSLSSSLDHGAPSGPEIALVKDLATLWVQEVVEVARGFHQGEIDPDAATGLGAALAEATMLAPIATIGGGTTEILRSVASKGLLGTSERRGEVADDLVANTVVKMFRERVTLDVIVAAESGDWAADLWNVAADAGLPWIGVPEEAGGAGGSFEDLLSVVRWAGYFAVPLPIGEAAIGARLLAEAGLQIPPGPLAVSFAPDAGLDVSSGSNGLVLSGVLRRVPWARHCERIVTLIEAGGVSYVASIPQAKVKIRHGRNIAFEPRDDVVLEGVTITEEEMARAENGLTPLTLRMHGALLRATQIAGASQAAADMAVDYAKQRHAFGRPIARYQAIQQHMVRAAAESALACIATSVATQDFGSGLSLLHVGAAKVVAGRTARTTSALAHQIHAAIGMTQEYPLHTRTRRMWSWAQECGTEYEWASEVGRLVQAEGAERLWPTLSAVPEQSH